MIYYEFLPEFNLLPMLTYHQYDQLHIYNPCINHHVLLSSGEFVTFTGTSRCNEECKLVHDKYAYVHKTYGNKIENIPSN